MQKYRISIVSYLNSYPFLIGLENSPLINQIILEKDVPAICSQKLIDKKVDIGLVPVATVLRMNQYNIISDYCIGAETKVMSVMLFSQSPIKEIKEIYLDYQSRTSVRLIQILTKYFWKTNPIFIQAQPGYIENIKENTAGVVIGDRTFDLQDKFEYKYDLAQQWNIFSGLPFVFATWTTNSQLKPDFEEKFNHALKYGVEHINLSVKRFESENGIKGFDTTDYLENYVSYDLTNEKREGMNLFLKLCREMGL